MKIAVIGGNLLACSTVLNLSLVQEHDERVFQSATKFQITLFESLPRLGGNSLRSISIPEHDIAVQVGRYRTLPLLEGSYLRELVDIANDHRGTYAFFGRRFAIPGSTTLRRGRVNAVNVVKPWQSGSYGRVVRSFAAWDWADDRYHLTHSGWTLLDILHRIFDNALWRWLFLALLAHSVRGLLATHGKLARAIALLQSFIILLIALYTPKRLIASWQTHYSFWASTLPMLFRHGITPAIARGGTVAFSSLLAESGRKNTATCAVGVEDLLRRMALQPYVASTADDYVRKFKYDEDFVRRFIEPVVAVQYGGKGLSQVSAMEYHLAMLDADFGNADAAQRLARVVPDNAALCDALVEAAGDGMQVETRLECAVTRIEYDEETEKYAVSTEKDETPQLYDGVVLCASPERGNIIFDCAPGIMEMLRSDPPDQEKDTVAAQESPYEPVIKAEACSHLGVITGTARATFFRKRSEKEIPDLITLSHAPLSQFERLHDGGNGGGVYRVICGADFVGSGLLDEMFEGGAQVRYMQKRECAVERELPVVWGKKFVYGRAGRGLGRHAEVDAVLAGNCASLFSEIVGWEVDGEGGGGE